MFDVLIAIKDDVPFLALDLERDDFIFELARFLCSLGFVLRLQRKLILLLARDTEFLCDVFCGSTHVVLIVDIPQTIVDHRIDQLGIALSLIHI